MLDEWKEYGCYLNGNLQEFPMQREALDGKNGFRRPIKILARGFFEKWAALESDSVETWPQIQKVTACKWFLRAWLYGLTPSKIPVFDDLPASLQQDVRKAGRHGLSHYAKEILSEEKYKSFQDTLKSIENSPYWKTQKFGKNNYGTIYLDQVIADAINRVPLRRQCLALKGETALAGIRCKEQMRQVAMAAAAFYLQARDEYFESRAQTYLDINYAELGNWINVYFTGKGEDRQSIPAAINTAKDPTGQLLFEKLELPNGNKIKLSREWIEKYQAQLIYQEEAKTYLRNGFFVVSDGDRTNKNAPLHIQAPGKI